MTPQKTQPKTKVRVRALGSEITKRRLKRGWDRKALADRVALSAVRIEQLELGTHGTTKIETAQRIADALRCELEDIFEIVEVPVRKKAS